MQINSVKTNSSPAFGCHICKAAEKTLVQANIHPDSAKYIVNAAKEKISPHVNFCELPQSLKIKKLLNPFFDTAETTAKNIQEGKNLDELLQDVFQKTN